MVFTCKNIHFRKFSKAKMSQYTGLGLNEMLRGPEVGGGGGEWTVKNLLWGGGGGTSKKKKIIIQFYGEKEVTDNYKYHGKKST